MNTSPGLDKLNKQFIDCSVQILTLLIRCYDLHQISGHTFQLNSEIKINFLENNLNTIKDSVARKEAAEILQKCYHILSFETFNE